MCSLIWGSSLNIILVLVGFISNSYFSRSLITYKKSWSWYWAPENSWIDLVKVWGMSINKNLETSTWKKALFVRTVMFVGKKYNWPMFGWRCLWAFLWHGLYTYKLPTVWKTSLSKKKLVKTGASWRPHFYSYFSVECWKYVLYSFDFEPDAEHSLRKLRNSRRFLIGWWVQCRIGRKHIRKHDV